jgi:nicotinamidase-related amidase
MLRAGRPPGVVAKNHPQEGVTHMTSQTIRDPVKDQLLTPKNSALVVIDYQPIQVDSIQSMDQELLVDNIVRVTRTAKTYDLPIVVSTVNVKTGKNKPMIPELQALLPGIEPLDRTTINAWEDTEFVAAIKATGRKKLVMAALWTEACLTFPTLDALIAGYEVYPVVDAVGGTSVEAHRAGLERIFQAGAKPVSWAQLLCELQRDWRRAETVKAFADILFDPKVPFIAAKRPTTVGA